MVRIYRKARQKAHIAESEGFEVAGKWRKGRPKRFAGLYENGHGEVCLSTGDRTRSCNLEAKNCIKSNWCSRYKLEADDNDYDDCDDDAGILKHKGFFLKPRTFCTVGMHSEL